MSGSFLRYGLGKLQNRIMHSRWLHGPLPPSSRALSFGEQSAKRAFVSYLTSPFSQDTRFESMVAHQNGRESLELASVLSDLGYRSTVVAYDKPCELPEKPQDLVFGFYEPFRKVAEANPGALKVFYGTGTYWRFQNDKVLQRTAELNARRGSRLPLKRLVEDSDTALGLADAIMQIGSASTISTYPAALQPKVRLIRQSSCEILYGSVLDKDYEQGRKRFLWFGSAGAVLKGLDLVLETFARCPSLELHVVGAPESEFVREFRRELFGTKNITFWGWLPLSSHRLLETAKRCAFVILPSAAEGVPGSVLNMMRLGLVPVVSDIAACDCMRDYGFVVPTECLTLSGIQGLVECAAATSAFELRARARSGQAFVMDNFSISTFRHDVMRVLTDLAATSGSLRL